MSRLVGFTYHFLNHVHNLLLDQIKALSIASRRAADDIVNLDVIVILADSTSIHRIGELDEDGVLLHDSLDVLTTDANNALVVLVRDVERYLSRHLLFHEIESVLGSFVLGATHIDVEVVFIEAIKDDLHVACKVSAVGSM